MASPAYELILAIQALDLSIDQLRHRGSTHPSRDELASVDDQLVSHDGEVTEVETHQHDLERQLKRLEDEAALIADRRRDIDGRLYGGEVQASKELLALQDEAASLLAKQTGIEDEELELMEQLEEVQQDLTARASARASIEERRRAVQAELDRSLAEIEAEVAQLAADRTARSNPTPGSLPGWDDLLGRYEDLRPQFDGVPVARLVDGRCDGCHIQLSAVAVDRMGKMAEDAAVTCEECGRLLVR